MQRKVIQLGKSTLVVSLPQKWVQKHNVKQGSTLNTIEAQSGITYALPEPAKINTIIDITNTARFAKRRLAAKYIAGYDHITIKGPPELLRNCMHRSEALVGVEVTEHTKNQLVVETLGEENTAALQKARKRVQFLTKQILDQTLACENEEDFALLMQMERNMNRFYDYAIRLLYKEAGESHKEAINLYRELTALENICDECKVVALQISRKEKKLLEDIRGFVVTCITLIHLDDLAQTENLAQEYEHIKRQLNLDARTGHALHNMLLQAWELPNISAQN